MKLVVTIPALNEEHTIAQVVSRVPRRIPGVDAVEVIVVNDGSTDRTAERAAEAGALVVSLYNRPGLGKVFGTGLERAMSRGADIIVNIEGDGQHDPADIRKLVQPILEGEADFVTCSRFADPNLWPTMPKVKFWFNRVVTNIINWICGGTSFTDVSCEFRAFNREAAYRLTLFGRFTYTQETIIDLFAKGLRMAEVPLRVRGVREHGNSRVALSILKYATNTLPIVLRAMRDIQPLKFFGGIALLLFLVAGSAVTWYAINRHPLLINVSIVLLAMSFMCGLAALRADQSGRHRKLTEELLYLTRRRAYIGELPQPRPIMASVRPAPAVERLFEESWELEDDIEREIRDPLPPTAGSGPVPTIAIVWEPDALSAEAYAEIVAALGDVVRANGGSGIERVDGFTLSLEARAGVPA